MQVQRAKGICWAPRRCEYCLSTFGRVLEISLELPLCFQSTWWVVIPAGNLYLPEDGCHAPGLPWPGGHERLAGISVQVPSLSWGCSVSR